MDKITNNKICILGSANVDSFVYVKHIPLPGQTIQADRYIIANGGKGANQAVAAAKLAGSAIFTGQVGQDDQMRNLKKQMQQAKVTLSWKLIPQIPTGKAFIYVDKNTGQNSIVIVGGANTYYPITNHLPTIYQNAINNSQLLQLQKQIPMQINLLASQYTKSQSKIVVLDCGGRDDPIPEQLLHHLDIISPNQTELLRLDPNIDIDNPVEQIRNKILSKYQNLKVLLKLGSKGSSLITNNIAIHCDVVSVINPQILNKYKILDTVGAGDCFTSAFCVRLLELDWNEPSKEADNYLQAMLFGNSAAFLCITKMGAMASMPDRLTTDLFIEEFELQKRMKVVDCANGKQLQAEKIDKQEQGN